MNVFITNGGGFSSVECVLPSKHRKQSFTFPIIIGTNSTNTSRLILNKISIETDNGLMYIPISNLIDKIKNFYDYVVLNDPILVLAGTDAIILQETLFLYGQRVFLQYLGTWVNAGSINNSLFETNTRICEGNEFSLVSANLA